MMTHGSPHASRPEPSPFRDDDLDTFAKAVGFHDNATTGDIQLVTGPDLGGMRRPQYLVINDGNCTYAVNAIDAAVWLDGYEPGDPDETCSGDAYTDFCQTADLVTDDELAALVDDLPTALGGVDSDAFETCYPVCSYCGERHNERDDCDDDE